MTINCFSDVKEQEVIPEIPRKIQVRPIGMMSKFMKWGNYNMEKKYLTKKYWNWNIPKIHITR